MVSYESTAMLTLSTTCYLSSQVDKLTPAKNPDLNSLTESVEESQNFITMNLVSSSLLARGRKMSAQDRKPCSLEQLFDNQ